MNNQQAEDEIKSSSLTKLIIALLGIIGINMALSYKVMNKQFLHDRWSLAVNVFAIHYMIRY